MTINQILLSLRSLTVFRSLLKDPVISAFCVYCEKSESGNTEASVDAYCGFIGELYNSHCESLAEYIQKITFDDENVYIRTVGAGNTPPEHIEASVKRELCILQNVADLQPDDLTENIGCGIDLPAFAVKKISLEAEYFERCNNVGSYGYGIYSGNHMFYLDESGHIVPVRSPDTIRLSNLIDYKLEQNIIIENTLALIEGRPTANILLTGDAGTGKSSTVKAIVNEFRSKGLRILEIRKEQLRKIPAIIDELSENPLKFIIFIDDLSFVKDDDNFSALKAILEGSVSAKSSNVAIYATSNRRHLVKEKFSDREGDDIHRNDTMQEIISLSERFGIHITFQRPDKKTYLNIVHALAKENGITVPEEELDIAAERFALGRGNRSARAAKQFIDGIIAANNKE